MKVSENYLSIKDALKYLAEHGVVYHEMTLRSMVSTKEVKSRKLYSSRLIHRRELDRLITERRFAGRPSLAEMSDK